MFGFGRSHEGCMREEDGKITKPIRLDNFGEVEFVNAWDTTCTIDRYGNLSIGHKGARITTVPTMATSNNDTQFVIDVSGDLWSWGSNNCGQLGLGDKTDRFH